ncbi:MAG: dephospho-CoA kinase [Chthoniobacterales bacterium]
MRRTLAESRQMDFFDADGSVHRLLDTESAVAARIRSLFGADFLQPDGKPDRPALRSLVFANAKARRELEDLLHPLVRAEWQAGRERCISQGRDYLTDIPLLYETSAERFFDAVVVVACSRETQLARLEGRGIELQTAEAMLASQLPLGQKVDRASFVIWNDGSLAALGRQTDLVANQLFHD